MIPMSLLDSIAMDRRSQLGLFTWNDLHASGAA